MREIITLQLGQQANYLATHFWNTQASSGRPTIPNTVTCITALY